MKNTSRGAPPVNDYGNLPSAPGKARASSVTTSERQPATDKASAKVSPAGGSTVGYNPRYGYEND